MHVQLQLFSHRDVIGMLGHNKERPTAKQRQYHFLQIRPAWCLTLWSLLTAAAVQGWILQARVKGPLLAPRPWDQSPGQLQTALPRKPHQQGMRQLHQLLGKLMTYPCTPWEVTMKMILQL